MFLRVWTARLAALAALVSLAGAAAPARANDSEAVLSGGVLTLKKSDGIVMESEELTISPDQVDVSYVFRNTTASAISTRVAFPMAPYEYEEGPLDEEELAEVRKQSWNDFGNFSVVVDGKPAKFETAIDAKRDAIAVTHHWLQTFPAGKTISVKHKFTPRGGFIFSFPLGGKKLAQELARAYCVGPVLLRAMKKVQGNITQVHYVLKTGANWKGPIGRFVLRLEKASAKQKVSLCIDGFKKVDDRTFLLEKADFVPTDDLKVAFIDY
jgi:hypothetical protein